MDDIVQVTLYEHADLLESHRKQLALALEITERNNVIHRELFEMMKILQDEVLLLTERLACLEERTGCNQLMRTRGRG